KYSDLLQMFFYENEEEALYRADQFSNELSGKIVATEELVSLHHEAIMEITRNLAPENSLRVINRGLVFLLGVMVTFGAKNSGGKYSKETLNNWTEAVLRLDSSLALYKNKHELILDSIAIGVLTINKKGELTFVNNALEEIMGFNIDDCLGENLALLKQYCSDQPAETDCETLTFTDLVIETLETGKIFSGEENYSCGKILKITTSPIRDKTGNITEVIALIQNITEQRQLEKAVMNNEKLATVGTLAAGIAHEIRNPLTSVRGFIQLLEPELANSPKKEFLDIILGELDRVNNFITNFLNSTKPSLPKQSLEDIAVVLSEVQILIESEALLREIDLRFSYPTKIPCLHIDKDQIKQVLLNVLKNAFDAVGPQGKVEVTVQRQTSSPGVSLFIKDNGKGMDQQTLARIFDPFFTTKKTGTGLGMAVTYQIIRNHGGDIKINSIPGIGSTFIINLPLAEADQEQISLAN
ncbi:MAG TPA: ATP-binding protein, partial [Desulfitobacteriaceae bacterium]|nr:ATP-binding protein [Desulfitobacteriaceae bacterium]